MCHALNEKTGKEKPRKDRTVKSRKQQNTWRQIILRMVGYIRNGHHQTEMREKERK